jgi:hypothetical protein
MIARRISLVAWHVFKEGVRDRVLYGIGAFAVLLVAASLLIGQITAGQDVKISADSYVTHLPSKKLFAVKNLYHFLPATANTSRSKNQRKGGVSNAILRNPASTKFSFRFCGGLSNHTLP